MDDWQWIGQIASDHRLEPFIGKRLGETRPTGCEPELKERLASSYRRSQKRWLTTQFAIAKTSKSMSNAGLDHVFLKGASLCLSAYADPAVRVLRDFDILVRPDEVDHANSVLLQSGFLNFPDDRKAGIKPEKYQLPALYHPKMDCVAELHHDLASIPGYDTRPLARYTLDTRQAARLGGHEIPISSPMATFLHLVLHAGPKSLFDCGPLVLSDLTALLHTKLKELTALPEIAEQFDMSRSLALMTGLLTRNGGHSELLREFAISLPSPPPVLLEQAEKLLIVSPSKARKRQMNRELTQSGSGFNRFANLALKAFAPKRMSLARISGLPIDHPTLWTRYPQWLATRAVELLSGLADRKLISESGKDAELSRWMLNQDTNFAASGKADLKLERGK
jgi:hypothetical protein